MRSQEVINLAAETGWRPFRAPACFNESLSICHQSIYNVSPEEAGGHVADIIFGGDVSLLLLFSLSQSYILNCFCATNANCDAVSTSQLKRKNMCGDESPGK